MRRIPLLAAGWLLMTAVTAQADITVTSMVTGTGLAKLAEGETTTSIKGLKMMTSQQNRTADLATVIDLESDQYIVMQLDKEKAEVYEVAEIAEGLRSIGPGDIAVSLEPTGESREMLDLKCAEHDVKVRVTAANPGAPDIAMDVVIAGTVCLAPEAPGAAEYAEFYIAAAKKGLFFGDPKAAAAQPGREKAMTELYRAMAEKGLPLHSEISVGFEGEGMLAAMMKRMQVSTTTEVTAISTEAVPDERFEIPKGFKIKNQK